MPGFCLLARAVGPGSFSYADFCLLLCLLSAGSRHTLASSYPYLPGVVSIPDQLSFPLDDASERLAEQQILSDAGSALALRALSFLKANLPKGDAELPEAFLAANVALSIHARRASKWASDVPMELWLNDVLPYAW